MDIAFLFFAYTAGVLTFLSPCAFPLLPSYVSYFLTATNERKQATRRELGAFEIFLRGAGFGIASSLGFLCVFLVFGLISSVALARVGRLVPYLVFIVAAVLISMGLLELLGKGVPINLFPVISHRILSRFGGAYRPFIYGIGYAFASLGCSFPIFLLVISGAAAFSLAFEVISLVVYFLGMASLMIPISVVVSFSKGYLSERFFHLMRYVEKMNGIVLIATGTYLIAYEL